VAISFVMSVCLSICPSVRARGTTRPQSDGFSWNLILEDFSKICREDLRFIEIWRGWRILYSKTFVHSWRHFAEFFLEWETFQATVVEKIEAHILCLKSFPDNRAVNEAMWKYIVEADKPQMTIWRMRITYCVSTATNARSQYVTLIAFPL